MATVALRDCMFKLLGCTSVRLSQLIRLPIAQLACTCVLTFPILSNCRAPRRCNHATRQTGQQRLAVQEALRLSNDPALSVVSQRSDADIAADGLRAQQRQQQPPEHAAW
jgi:hypothetical protein